MFFVHYVALQCVHMQIGSNNIFRILFGRLRAEVGVLAQAKFLDFAVEWWTAIALEIYSWKIRP